MNQQKLVILEREGGKEAEKVWENDRHIRDESIYLFCVHREKYIQCFSVFLTVFQKASILPQFWTQLLIQSTDETCVSQYLFTMHPRQPVASLSSCVDTIGKMINETVSVLIQSISLPKQRCKQTIANPVLSCALFSVQYPLIQWVYYMIYLKL